MAYTLDYSINLGSAATGLTLEAQLVNSSGVNVGSAITTGFTEIGLGNYLWHVTTIPDGHRGGVKFQISPGGALKAFTAINPEEGENTDVKTSQVSGGGGGATAAQVWTYASRTLTQALAEVEAILAGTEISIRRGESVSVSLTGLGSVTGNSKLWLTVKDKITDTDAQALLQWERTVGLVRLNGGAGTASDGVVTVDDAALGNLTVTLKPASSVLLEPGTGRVYDVQMLVGTTVTTLREGVFTVTADVTRAIS